VKLTRISLLVVTALLVGLAAPPADGCTTFLLNDGRRFVFGKNYDWDIRSGMLIVNQRGMSKVSAADSGGNPARWTSRYGSVTFNQFGREFPMGGMNEAGLVVEVMWLEATVYPAADDRATLDQLQWIQYQLDTAKTVEDVLASDDRVRIVGGVPLHYLVADATGNAATVEFIGGRLVAHTGSSLPVAALTNDTYDTSVGYYERWPQGLGSTSSLDRFVTAAVRTSAFADELPADARAYAFATLSAVAQPGYTRWSIVYEISERHIHFRTDLLPAVRSLDITQLEFACKGPVRVLDLGAPVSGDIFEHLVPYTLEHNRSLIEFAFRSLPFLEGTPRSVLDEIALYPESTLCVGPLLIRRPSGRRRP
jgi:choloylglycine hydrolase